MDSFLKMLTSTISKYVFAVPFLLFGIMHMTNGADMADGVPGGVYMVYFTGLALIAAAVSIFIGKYTRLAMLLLGLMLLIFVVMVHIPMVSDPATFAAKMNVSEEIILRMGMGGMLKDLALAGGAWILADRYE